MWSSLFYMVDLGAYIADYQRFPKTACSLLAPRGLRKPLLYSYLAASLFKLKFDRISGIPHPDIFSPHP